MPILRGRAFGGPKRADEAFRVPSSSINPLPNDTSPAKIRSVCTSMTTSARRKEQPDPPLTVMASFRGRATKRRRRQRREAQLRAHVFPHDAKPRIGNVMMLRPREVGDPMALASAIGREVQAIDPDQPIGKVTTMEKNVTNSLAARRLTMTLLAAFAGWRWSWPVSACTASWPERYAAHARTRNPARPRCRSRRRLSPRSWSGSCTR